MREKAAAGDEVVRVGQLLARIQLSDFTLQSDVKASVYLADSALAGEADVYM